MPPESETAHRIVTLADHTAIEIGRREMLLSEIDGLIRSLNQLRTDLLVPASGRSQTMSNGFVESSLDNLLTSRGPRSY